jgi:hypothetical protein
MGETWFIRLNILIFFLTPGIRIKTALAPARTGVYDKQLRHNAKTALRGVFPINVPNPATK